MLLQFYKLREQPFGVTPDPRYLYASGTHREALSSLLYGVESGVGFVTLTAKPGMGKTTLLFETLARMRDKARTVFLFQTISSPADLVRALLIDLGVSHSNGSLVEMQTELNEILVAQSATGKRLVVAIDEAQNLSDEVLEAVRMLSNFETARGKLMQIILSGQLQLAERLATPQLLQLRQRISIFGYLKPFSKNEIVAYIHHRLRIAGYDSVQPLFSDAALDLIAIYSEGIPRNINNLCFNALSIGCALRASVIDADVVKEVISDLRLDELPMEMPAEHFKQVDAPAPQPVAAALQPVAPALQPVAPAAPQPVADIFESEPLQDDASEEDVPARRKIPVLAYVLIGCLVAFGCGWLGMQAFKFFEKKSPVQNVTAAVQTPAPVAESTTTSQSDPAPEPEVHRAVKVTKQGKYRTIRVQSGQSLSGICNANFGVCRPELLREIVRLNSTIRDPDRILSGQLINLPVAPSTSNESK